MEAHGRLREVRRVHIIYFISRKGRIDDHPHLLRVHHFCGNGVRLRDIKRWLSVVRGEDMPESYSWSYQRRYKTGYVWQDSLDEDLITPISDNEYVIKGSEFYSATSDYDDSSVAIIEHEESINVEAKSNYQNSEATQTDGQTKQQLIDIHEAPDAALINDSTQQLEETKHLISTNEQCDTKNKRFRLNFLKNKNTKSKKMLDSSASTLICSSKKICARKLFRKMISCGMVDTTDSAIKAMRRASQ